MGYGNWEGSILETSLQRWLYRSQAFLGSGEMGRPHASKGIRFSLFPQHIPRKDDSTSSQSLVQSLCRIYNPTTYKFPQRSCETVYFYP